MHFRSGSSAVDFSWDSERGKRNENELTDTSEVIRAAGASEIRADYILQVSGFDTLEAKRESVYLLSNPAFRAFLDKYPAVQRRYASEKLSYFPCELLQASLNAKLIDVGTGNVVWIGNHLVTELDSADNEANMTLEVSYRKYCGNCEEVIRLVNALNTESARQQRADKPQPSLPPLRYVDDVSSPRKISGSQCEVEQRDEAETVRTRRQLASRVAEELIQTIKFRDVPTLDSGVRTRD